MFCFYNISSSDSEAASRAKLREEALDKPGGLRAVHCGLGGVLREGGDELRDEAETKLLLGCRRC